MNKIERFRALIAKLANEFAGANGEKAVEQEFTDADIALALGRLTKAIDDAPSADAPSTDAPATDPAKTDAPATDTAPAGEAPAPEAITQATLDLAVDGLKAQIDALTKALEAAKAEIAALKDSTKQFALDSEVKALAGDSKRSLQVFSELKAILTRAPSASEEMPQEAVSALQRVKEQASLDKTTDVERDDVFVLF